MAGTKPPKKVRSAVDSLLQWLENTDRKHVDGVLRFIASFPGADELEDAGIEPSIPLMGWSGFQEIQGVMDAIEGRSDVEYLVERLLRSDEEDR